MRILITGGGGYVGSVLVGQLRQENYTVRVLDNLDHGLRCGSHVLKGGGMQFVYGDVRDERALAGALDGCDAVVHLAAIVGFPACDASPVEAKSVNVDGTRSVLRAAGGRPVILLSTLSTLGRVGSANCDEETVPRPVSLYASTKLQSELLAREYGECVILRPATAFGLAPQMRFDLLIHRLTLDALNLGAVKVYEPMAMRCFVHVRDLSRAIILAIEHFSSMRGDVFHVGNGRLNVTKAEIANMLKDLTGCSVTVDTSTSDGDARDYGGTFEKIEREGFKPQNDLLCGIQELLRGMAASR